MMISWWRHDDVIEESPTQRLFVQKTVLKRSFHPCNDIRVLDQFDMTSVQHALKKCQNFVRKNVCQQKIIKKLSWAKMSKISVPKISTRTDRSGLVRKIGTKQLVPTVRISKGASENSRIFGTMEVPKPGPLNQTSYGPVYMSHRIILKIETKCDSNRKVRKSDEMAFYN